MSHRHRDQTLGGCSSELRLESCPHCVRDQILWNLSEAITGLSSRAIGRASDVPKAVAAIKEAHAYVYAMTFRPEENQ